MALFEDVIALVHDLSSAGLAVTLISPPTKPSGDASDQINSLTTEQGNIETKFTEEEDGKQQKYIRMSEEVCPTRDSGVLQKKRIRKVDVRYLNEIKSFKDRIKSSCLLSCNQQRCPVMRERLNQHQLEHHEKIDNFTSTQTYNRDQAINVSPTLSRIRLPKFTLPLPTNEGRIAQTDITMRDFSQNSHLIPKHLSNMTTNTLKKDIPLRKSETREVLPRMNFYKEHLQNEILNWLTNVPMFYTLNYTTKYIRNNIVNNLAEKINELAVEAYDKDYEIKVNFEIENCLGKLPMWLPGSKHDQTLFKDGLREKLWNKIQELNENFLGTRYEKAVGYEIEEDNTTSKESYEKEIEAWSVKLLLSSEKTITRRQVVDLIMRRLSPLLKIPLHTTSYKLILKGEIVDILDDLPLTLTSPRHRTVHLNRFAEDLANRLLNVQIKHEAASSKNTSSNTNVFHRYATRIMSMPQLKSRSNLKKVINANVSECLNKVQVSNLNDLKTEICSIFLDSKGYHCTGDELKNEICQFLRDTGKLPAQKTQNVAKMIIKHVKESIKEIKNSATTSFDFVIPELSGTISVYRWGDETPVTSTPKKSSKKVISKLNADEKSYMVQVAALIRLWMDTLPKQYNENKKFKDTIIDDLAGDIMDELKLEQLAPETRNDKEKHLNYLMYRWLYRFEFFDDATIRYDAKPYIADFMKKLNNISVPKLTAPQHGTRQAMENIKHMESASGWDEDYLAKGIDVLEDQISVWMNEQPSEIYSYKDKGKRDKMIHELALNLQDRLRNKSPETVIEKDINQWLTKILSQNLKEKVINIPQDQTLEARHEKRKRYMADHRAAKRQGAAQLPTQDVSNVGNIEGDPDKTIREFIAKFIKHNYDIDDPMAVGAFSHLLKTELRRISPPSRKEIYDNFDKSTNKHFLPDKLKKELEYIKAISDWLKNIPIDAAYNTPGNRDRIEFINDLARNIQEIEEQRSQSPDELNYNYLIASITLQSMNTYGLPILPEHKNNTPLMVDQLLQKLVVLNDTLLSAKNESQPSIVTDQSLNISDIKEQNLSDFIADYIRVNGRDIADDEMKLEAWTARLLKEVKKMLHDGADPSTLCKAQVYTKFADVPIPSNESVRRFSLEITYVKEISDWLKNLPLLPIANQPQAEEERIQMISALAEKMTEREILRNSETNYNIADKKFQEYVANWISRLPLDPRKDIVVPIVVQQLMNRMKRVSKSGQPISETPPMEELRTSDESSKSVGNDSSQKGSKGKNQSKSKPLDQQENKEGIHKQICNANCPFSPNSNKYDKGKKNPAATIVEAVENWSNHLPIKGDDKEQVQFMKEGIARKLYQKIGELNVDPRIFNDDMLYKDILGDEIDTQFENVPQNPKLQKNREKLKEGLLNTILDTNRIIKERSTGDNYKHKLETTIDASIPNPVHSTQAFDPGFEIYKNHLANIFILENFDHANDDVKAKYEKRVRFEIDKYFENAQNKNALPLTKDQIYNELYSALFKVPMPNESSVIDEVEQVKTRCEIDTWFENLPLKEADGITELLERDQILSLLAKRIHEIEKSEPKADNKIHKEIIKWLEKLPLIPEHEDIDTYANKLQSILKLTAEDRKYVATENRSRSKGKSKQIQDRKSKKGSPRMSQVAGPSSDGQNWVSPLSVPQSKATIAKPCCLICPMAQKKPGDIIVEVVEEWCNQLPLISSEENNRAIKDNLSTRIIIQISELNMDPDIFNDDIIYNELLDEELENIMSNLPVCCDFQNSKAARKYQLKEIIKSIKPLIKEEKARHEYKEELNTTIANILKEPQNTTVDKVALFNKLKDEIVENFVQYNYNKNDEEGRHVYKNNVHDAVVKYFMEVKDTGTDEQVDPLVIRNQLLSELGKIPVPNEALKEEVEEINMRNQVEQFFEELSIPEGDAKNKMKRNLSKRLCNIEKSGHNCTNDKKMKSDISRCLKKLNKDVSPKVVEDFVDILKNNEAERKTPPLTSSQAAGLNQAGLPGSPRTIGPRDHGRIQQAAFSPQRTQRQSTYSQTASGNESGQQWFTLLPTTPPHDIANGSGYYRSYHQSYRPEIVWSPYANASNVGDQSLGRSVMHYEDFVDGPLLSSSAAPKGYAAPGQTLGQYPVNSESLKGGPILSFPAVQNYGVPEHHSHQSQSSMNKSQAQQDHLSMRVVPSAPVQTQSSYGQIVTPRQVAQSPRRVLPSPRQVPQAATQNETIPRDDTPDSLFQAPIFKPIPLHYPLRMPIFESVPLPSSVGSVYPRRPLQSPDNTLVPSPRGLPIAAPPMADVRRLRSLECSDDEEILCRCKRRGLPFCMFGMEDYFDDCIGLEPMLCRMHCPEYFYY